MFWFFFLYLAPGATRKMLNCSPGKDLDSPPHTGVNPFLLVRSFSDALLSFLCFFLFFFTSELSFFAFSRQMSCSQHCPGTLTRLGFAQPNLVTVSSCGQRETHPTAPSMQVHWCLQFGRKISPFWYILLLYSHVLPSNLAGFKKQKIENIEKMRKVQMDKRKR